MSSLEPKITVSVKEVGDLLSHIKGGGQVSLTQPSQRNAVSTEAEDSLKPLMDLLDGTWHDRKRWLIIPLSLCGNLPTSFLFRFVVALRRVLRKGSAQTSAQGIVEDCHAHHGENHRSATDDRQERKFTHYVTSCIVPFTNRILLPDGTDDPEELDRQRQEFGCQCQNRGHVTALQEQRCWQTGCQERPQRCHGLITAING